MKKKTGVSSYKQMAVKRKLNYHNFYLRILTWIYLALSSLIFEKTFKLEPVPDMTLEP